MTNADSLPLKQRVNSIDILRGLIMLVMALDHTRDMCHNAGFLNDPTNLATTTPILFFTRWITHFCAPNFVFLSGISAYIAGSRRTKSELSGFLIKRGLWLILIELTIITFAFSFNPFFNVLVFQVIWAIGFSMVILGVLIGLRAPFWLITTIGVIIFLGHDLWDYAVQPASGAAFVLVKVFFTSKGTFIPLDKSHFIFDLYAVLPWTGVMIVGYAFGSLFKPGCNGDKRRTILLYSGLGALVLFVILRFINLYGDPVPWAVQARGGVYTFISFFNISKYPPSLLYLLLTLGAGITILSLTEKVSNKLTSVFIIYGNVPFFYYILHFYLIRVANVIIFFAQGYTIKQIVNPNSPTMFNPTGYGIPLGGVYLVWLAVIIILYFPCRWYSKYKKTHRQWWLSYM